MKITTLEVKLNYQHIAEGLIADTETYDKESKQVKLSNKVTAWLSLALAVVVSVAYALMSENAKLHTDAILFLVVFAFAYVATRATASFSQYCKYQYFYGMNEAKARDVYNYVKKNMRRVPDMSSWSEERKFEWLNGIPWVGDFIKNYNLIVAAQGGRCSINLDWEQKEVTFIDMDTFDTCSRDLDDYFFESKFKHIEPRDIACVLTESCTYIYEIGSMTTGVKVKFIDGELKFGETVEE